MSGIMTKRQQARNEKILQDLLKNVPGNDRCADCGTKNPGSFTSRPSISCRFYMHLLTLYRRMGQLECEFFPFIIHPSRFPS